MSTLFDLSWSNFTTVNKEKGRLSKLVKVYLAMFFFSLSSNLFGVLPTGIYKKFINLCRTKDNIIRQGVGYS